MSDKQLQQYFDTYFGRVFGYFFRRLTCKQDVEDLTMISINNFLQALRQNKIQSASIAKIEGYLWRIVHNQLCNFIRNKSKKPIPLTLDENWQFIDEKVEKKHSKEYEKRLQTLLECMQNQLDSKNLEIVKMSFLQEKNSTEIGEILNLKPATVRQKISRSLAKVRSNCLELWKGYQK